MKCKRCVPPICIGIGGATRSGKSTLAKSLQEHFSSPIPSISQDHFYLFIKPITEFDKDHIYANWECLEAIDSDSFLEFIQNEKKKATKLCEECQKISGKKYENLESNLIFVEGFLLFMDERIVSEIDKKIFLCIDKENCKKRRLDTKKVSEFQFEKLIWPSYLQYHRKYFSDKKFDGLILNANRPKEEILQICINYINGISIKGDEEFLNSTLFEKKKLQK